MSEATQKSTKTQLALAIAQGLPISARARTRGVPRRTAFRWAKERDVRKAVESYRRRTIDQAVGRMAKGTTEAADLILKIACEADTYAVRLRAARAVFSDMIRGDNQKLEGQIRVGNPGRCIGNRRRCPGNPRRRRWAGMSWPFRPGGGVNRVPLLRSANLHQCTDAGIILLEYHFVPLFEVRDWTPNAQRAICKSKRHQ
jgi:hypothetical protein